MKNKDYITIEGKEIYNKFIDVSKYRNAMVSCEDCDVYGSIEKKEDEIIKLNYIDPEFPYMCSVADIETGQMIGEKIDEQRFIQVSVEGCDFLFLKK